jgi:hypothetical protein
MNYSQTKAGHQLTQYILFSYGVAQKGVSHIPPNPNDVQQVTEMMKADVYTAVRDGYEINLGKMNDSRFANMVPLPCQSIKFASGAGMAVVPVTLSRQVDPIRRPTN